MAKPINVDAYIASFPKAIQVILQQMRATVNAVAPQATEVISYGIPAVKWNGMLVWYGAHTNHLGFYPRGSAIAQFKSELAGYKGAKGSVQFPFDQPLPVDLITKMVAFRVAENLSRVKKK